MLAIFINPEWSGSKPQDHAKSHHVDMRIMADYQHIDQNGGYDRQAKTNKGYDLEE